MFKNYFKTQFSYLFEYTEYKRERTKN